MPEMKTQSSSSPVKPPQREVRFILIPIGLIITLIVAVFQFIAREKNPAPNIDQSAMNSGIHYYMDGDYDMAIVMFNQVIFQQPESGEAYNNLGLVYEAKGDLATALADFGKAIQWMPEPAVSYCNRANIYLTMGDFSRAMADLDQAIQLEADFSKAYYNRGLVQMALDNPGAAVADFSKAIEYSPLAQPSGQKMQQLSATLSDPFGIMEFSKLQRHVCRPERNLCQSRQSLFSKR